MARKTTTAPKKSKRSPRKAKCPSEPNHEANAYLSVLDVQLIVRELENYERREHSTDQRRARNLIEQLYAIEPTSGDADVDRHYRNPMFVIGDNVHLASNPEEVMRLSGYDPTTGHAICHWTTSGGRPAATAFDVRMLRRCETSPLRSKR